MSATQSYESLGSNALPAVDSIQEAAWREFVLRYRPVVLRAVRRSLCGVDRRRFQFLSEEDLAQEVFFRLVMRGARALDAFHGSSPAEAIAYLRRVARSAVVDACRAAFAEKRGGDVVVVSFELAASRLEADSRSCPERRLLARERRKLFLERCRDVLRPSSSTGEAIRVVELALLEGHPSREIAAIVGEGWGVSRVDSLLCRLRRRLAARGIVLPRRGRPPVAAQ